jgi:predicted HTH domain antitoxin
MTVMALPSDILCGARELQEVTMIRAETRTVSAQRTPAGVTFTFPEALLVASKEDVEQFRLRVLVATLGKLYEQGKVSSGFAAQLLGCDRREVYRLLSDGGFAVIDYAEGEEEYEAATSRALAARVTSP